MLIALMTDIHGNREAFAACLEHAHENGVERFVFLGDYVGYGADPVWVLDKVMSHVERGAIAVLGNHDEAAIGRPTRMNDTARATIEWTRPLLTSAHREFLASLPLSIEEDSRLYVHASASAPSQWEYIRGHPEAARCLQATGVRQTFCGHVHVPEVFHLAVTGKIAQFVPVSGVPIPLSPQRRWLAVIGSVGQPRDGNPAACYAVLDDMRNELTYVRVVYDVDLAAHKDREAGLPPVLSMRLQQGY